MIEREYVIRLRLPRSPRGRWLLLGALGVLALGALTYAAVPHTFTAGEPLSSAKLNENFGALDGRLAPLEGAGAYCGSTAPVQTRLDPTNGYAAGAMLCAAVAGCGAKAHICSPPEMSRWAAAGNGSVSEGWVATGAVDGTGSTPANDCAFFTSNGGLGTSWRNAGARHYDCANPVTLPLLCCR
jgi:hypothetical protein